MIGDYVRDVLAHGVSPEEIGIISPYQKQCQRLRSQNTAQRPTPFLVTYSGVSESFVRAGSHLRTNDPCERLLNVSRHLEVLKVSEHVCVIPGEPSRRI